MRKYPLLLNILEEFLWNWCFFPLNVWFTSPAIFSGPGIFFVIRFLVTPLISLKSLRFQVNFGSFCLSRNLLHLSCWTYWHKVLDNVCWMSSDAVSLISVTGNACYFPFFLISPARGVSVCFLIFSENWLSVSLIFFVVFHFLFHLFPCWYIFIMLILCLFQVLISVLFLASIFRGALF